MINDSVKDGLHSPIKKKKSLLTRQKKSGGGVNGVGGGGGDGFDGVKGSTIDAGGPQQIKPAY